MAAVPAIKVKYFNVKFYGEGIKYILAYADVPFEDVRIGFDQWPSLKEKTPFGKLPVLEVDGKELSQSIAICRYLGKRFGLATKDPMKEALLEALIDGHREVMDVLLDAYQNKDDKDKQEKEKEKMNFVYGKFNDLLSNGYFYSSEPTWVDIFIVAMMDVIENNKPGTFNGLPNMRNLCYKIKAKPSLKKYLETRPPYPVFNEEAAAKDMKPEEK